MPACCTVASGRACCVGINEVCAWLSISGEGFHEILLFNTFNSLKAISEIHYIRTIFKKPVVLPKTEYISVELLAKN